MGACPTTRTAESLRKPSGADNDCFVSFAICKVNDFANVSGRASQPTRQLTVTQPAALVQSNRQTPSASYAYTQSRWDADLPDLVLYRVTGGPYDGSDVTAETLIQIGIPVPAREETSA